MTSFTMSGIPMSLFFFGPFNFLFTVIGLTVIIILHYRGKAKIDEEDLVRKARENAERIKKEREAKKQAEESGVKVDLSKQTQEAKVDDNLSGTQKFSNAPDETASATVGREKESFDADDKKSGTGISEKDKIHVKEGVPYGQKPKAKFKMPDKDMYNVLLMSLGVVFVLLAGIIFATTNWHVMSGFSKLLCILFVVASVYAMSFFAERKFKLVFISRSLYMLASFLLFMAVLAIAYFKLLGIYLRLDGVAKYLTFFAASLCTEISLLLALKKFNKRWYTDICLYGISVCVCFLVMSFNMPLSFTVTYLTVYAILCVIADIYIEKSKTELISKQLKGDISAFAQINLLAVSIMVMFFFRTDMYQGIVTIVLALVHLYLGDRRENKLNSAGFVVFLALAIYRIAYGNFEHSVLYMLCMLLSIFTSINMIGTFRENTRSYANMASYISCLAIFTGVCYYYFADGGRPEFASLLSLSLVWIYNLINDIKYRKANISVFNSVTFMFLLSYALAYFNVNSFALQSLINVVLFSIVIIFGSKFRVDSKARMACIVNVSFFTVISFIDYVSINDKIWTLQALSPVICILISIYVYYVLSKENVLFGFFIPGLWAAILYILTDYANIYFNIKLSFEWILFTYLSIAFAYKLIRKRNFDTGLMIWTLLFGIIYTGGHSVYDTVPAPYFILSAAYMILHLVVLKEKKRVDYHILMLLDLMLGFFVSLIFAKIDMIVIFVILSAILFIISLLYEYVFKEKNIVNTINTISLFAQVSTVILYFDFLEVGSHELLPVYVALILILCVAYYVKGLIEKKQSYLIVTSISFWVFFMTKSFLELLSRSDYTSIVVLMIVTLSTIIYLRFQSPIIKEEDSKFSSYDWWSIAWGGHIIAVLFNVITGNYEKFYIVNIYLLFLILYCLQFIKVRKFKVAAQLSSALCCIILIWNPYFVFIPEVFDLEVKAFSWLLIPLALKGAVNRKEYRVINVLSRGAVLLVLTCAAVFGGFIEDSIVVLLFSVILLIYANVRKHWKEFLMAFSFAITIAVFMTRSFWTNVSWFVYLFAAGLLLIGLAVYNEIRRKRREAKDQVAEASKDGKEDRNEVNDFERADSTDASNDNDTQKVDTVKGCEAVNDTVNSVTAVNDTDTVNTVEQVNDANTTNTDNTTNN